MMSIRSAAAALLALGGLLAPAKAEDRVPEATLAFSDRKWEMLLLENGKIRRDYKSFKWNQYSTYFYGGRSYRKLTEREVARLDAMHRVKVEKLGLYLDGRRVRTDVLWVTEVLSAHHWGGGVLVVARTSRSRWHKLGENDIGFIDPRANRCRFTRFLEDFPLFPGIPDFLAPVTIDASNGDLELDVAFPERFSMSDRFDFTVSLTNRSGAPVQAPDSLMEGFGMVRVRKLRRPPGEEAVDEVWMKRSEPPTSPPSSPLGPRRTREFSVPFDADEMPRWPGRYRMVFYWDAFLDPDDGEKVSRFMCEKWVEVTE
jgi:hypothetical protein